jgi:hypothetical protein
VLTELPQHACQSKYCTNVGGFWQGTIVALGRSEHLIVGWCGLCDRFVCSDCALPLELPPLERSRLPDIEALEETCRRRDLKLWRMHCARCGTALQRGTYEPALVVR